MLSKKSDLPTSESSKDIKKEVLRQQIRFAQISSYCSLIAGGISTVVGLIGVGLVLHGNITIGTLTSISSFLTTKKLQEITAEANLRVDRLLQIKD